MFVPELAYVEFAPITFMPFWVTMFPAESIENTPSLVKYEVPSASWTTKNPVPEIIQSKSLPVEIKVPGAKFLVIPPILTPTPICFGFVPPPFFVAALPYERL